MERFAPLLGRIFLSAIFIISSVRKILDFEGTRAYMDNAGLPMTGVLLVGAIVFELAGGLSVLLGFKARLGAILLIIFLVPTTLVFHMDFSDQGQIIHFMKNLSILGGLLLVAAFGSGPYCLDRVSV